MTREIKFRAWNTHSKLMSPRALPTFLPEEIQISPITRIVDNAGILMQFTGLHDKNGKEIYEGDIVCNLPTKKSSLAPNGRIGFVFYVDSARSDGFYDCGFYLNYSGGIYLHIAKNCIIIGNIYENPELLK